jgi:hypothetical protein
MYDIFFISYHESNCEENWKRVLELHSNAKRISNVDGISSAHLLCEKSATTEKYWTIDGDSWLLDKLEVDSAKYNDIDLLCFNSIDAVDKIVSTLGSVKLWTKNSIIISDMSKGDFCQNATKTTKVMEKILSEHRYNVTPHETWKHSFRHMVKCFSGIIRKEVLQTNIDRMESHKDLNEYSYRGYLDAKQYVEECAGNFEKVNLINNYEWLEKKSPY